MRSASYEISVSDGTTSWSVGPDRLSSEVMVTERAWFVRDRQYTATATIITLQGNSTSALNFSELLSCVHDHMATIILQAQHHH